MSSYAIFAVIVTAAYFVYYAVVIACDLIKMSRQEKDKAQGEEIELPYSPIVPIQVIPMPDVDESLVREANRAANKEAAEERLESIQERMDKTVPEYRNAFAADEFEDDLEGPEGNKIHDDRMNGN